MRIKLSGLMAVSLVVGALTAKAVDVVIRGEGAEKIPVALELSNGEFTQTLKRNLELSGFFKVQATGSVKVYGTLGAVVRAEGRGELITMPLLKGTDRQERQAAREFCDLMVKTYAKVPGFASEPIAFVRVEGKAAEICKVYPDGRDLQQLTHDGVYAVGPRWENDEQILYTGYVNGGPQVFELDSDTGKRRLKWSFGNLTAGAAVSPDGTKVALVSSMHGNPELYVIDLATRRWSRLTKTPLANEGQPSWSPDSRYLVYVSDENRRQHLFMIDLATRSKRRLTSQGTQNVDPDWGEDGRIVYLTKRGGLGNVAVLNPAEGDRTAQLVTTAGGWEHPTWARDRRHLCATHSKALHLLDTISADEGGDAPRRLFANPGKWINPSWRRRR